MSNVFSETGAIVSYTVTVSGTYDLAALGANGGAAGAASGGAGAEVEGDFTLIAGETLEILVGGVGHAGVFNTGAGGGGGTFVVLEGANGTGTLLEAAGGGGGGASDYGNSNGGDGQAGTGGGAGDAYSPVPFNDAAYYQFYYLGGSPPTFETGAAGSGGASGGGGAGGAEKVENFTLYFNPTSTGGGGGGAGYSAAGGVTPSATVAAQSFLSGGAGGTDSGSKYGAGGFGGGGAGDNVSGGGGGGYSGGGGGGYAAGGGGGSYIDASATDDVLTSGFNAGANLVSGGNGQVTLTLLQAACFARGTRIATPRGDVAIEALHVGDLVLTASGVARPIRWIGWRALDLSRHADPDAVRPLRILAGAFGEGLPRRDLCVSPGHHIAFEGALIEARRLVNGATVAPVAGDRVEYWHVELETHDLLLSEGLASESYLDAGNRAAFANGAAFIEAHPDFRPRHWAETCLPIAHDGPRLAAARAALLARLPDFGFAITPDADAHLIADGRRIDPVEATPTRLVFDAPEAAAALILRSRTFCPARTRAGFDDPRELGLCVARLEIDGEAAPLASAASLPGWRRAEGAERFSHRWTDGATPLPRGGRVVIDLAGPGHYLTAAPLPLARACG